MKKLNKDRVYKHMSRETVPRIIVYLYWHDLTMPSQFYADRHVITEDHLPLKYRRCYRHWVRLMEAKNNGKVLFEMGMQYDIDFNRYIFCSTARASWN